MKTKKEMPITFGLMEKEWESVNTDIQRITGRYNRAKGEADEASDRLKIQKARIAEINYWLEEHEPNPMTKAEALLERMVEMYGEGGNRFTEKQKHVIATILNEEDAK
tara:strand:- start:241 stop:564 length:324 start_codon:yes stop_codon:yes gene_type:complete